MLSDRFSGFVLSLFYTVALQSIISKYARTPKQMQIYINSFGNQFDSSGAFGMYVNDDY